MVKTLIALPILTNFTQHLVKIGLKLVLNSFASLKLQNPRPWGGGRVLPYKDSTGMCRAKAPPAPSPPHFWTLLLYCSDVGHSKRPPFQKYTILCSAFPIWAERKDRRFKKNIRFFVIFNSQIPFFP